MAQNSNSEIVLEGRNISKDFTIDGEPNRVIHNIDIKIYNGHLTMLIGPSGCGKTTLISILSGILSASEGSVLILGHNLNEYIDEEKVKIRRDNLGFIFQQYNLLAALTASENAAMALLIRDDPAINFEYATERANKILEIVGMEKHVNKLPKQLSGGQQQRVAIARALVHEPRIIICDEPTAALDKNTGTSVMEILKNIVVESNGHKTVLVVTHDNRVYHYADRIIMMSDGRIVADYIGKELDAKIKQMSTD